MARRRVLHGWGVLPIVAVLLTATPLAAQEVWVDDDNCPGPGTGTFSDPYCLIQDAICDIKDTGGGDVLVSPGYYNESLRVFTGVSVISTDGPAVTHTIAASHSTSKRRSDLGSMTAPSTRVPGGSRS